MIRLALVGRGRWGQNYIKAISQIKECELPKEFIRSRDYADLLFRKDIDGVVIATPASTHFKIARQFLKKGFNLLIEKPLTTSLKDALELKKIQKKTNKIIMVGHIYNYNNSFIELINKIEKIGKIRYLESEGSSFNLERKDVSALWDWGPHDIYMACRVFNKKPLSVSAWDAKTRKNTTNDECFLKLKFKKQVFAFIKLSWIATEKKRNLKVVGSDGILLFDDLVNEKLKFIDFKNKKIFYKTKNIEPLYSEVLEFVECIKKNREPKASLDEGIMTIKVLDAAERSLNQNGKEIIIN